MEQDSYETYTLSCNIKNKNHITLIFYHQTRDNRLHIEEVRVALKGCQKATRVNAMKGSI